MWFRVFEMRKRGYPLTGRNRFDEREAVVGTLVIRDHDDPTLKRRVRVAEIHRPHSNVVVRGPLFEPQLVAADERGMSISGWVRIQGEPHMTQEVAQSWVLRGVRVGRE